MKTLLRQQTPANAAEQAISTEFVRLIRKLRWIGMEDEADVRAPVGGVAPVVPGPERGREPHPPGREQREVDDGQEHGEVEAEAHDPLGRANTGGRNRTKLT